MTGSAQPKKPTNAYAFFFIEIQGQLRAQYPETKPTEIAQMVGKAWGELDDTKKQVYIDMYLKDKKRYEQELEQLGQHGFFITQNGENSKDLFQPVIGDDIVQPKKPFSAYIFFSNAN